MATLPTPTSSFSARPHTEPEPSSPPRPPTKFRFKSKSKPSQSSPNHSSQPQSRSRSRSPSQKYRHHHRRRHRYRHSPPPSKSDSTPPISPNRAFRESLFDALADDEGAAFWEGVYGQPIHTYSAYHNASDSPDGTLERMTDEEYVAHVRAKMWERSHGYVAEERQRRRRQAEEEKNRRKEEEGRQKDWETRVEEALRRREQRKDGKWKESWEGYVNGWLKEIVWPVESGRREDVRREEVERFFHHAPFWKTRDGPRGEDFGTVLKAERVRWHPDKVQQRFGSQGIDEKTMKTVTAVFQIVDGMWTETR